MYFPSEKKPSRSGASLWRAPGIRMLGNKKTLPDLLGYGLDIGDPLPNIALR